ncbi:MAG: hypothetical protein LBR40_05650 [Bacilli bacterium]|jgi:N utilization substance protein B|nr:hypothetical protein [Bacilli bacterium]
MDDYSLNQRQAREASLVYLYQLIGSRKIALETNESFNIEQFIKDLFPGLNYQLQEKFKTDKAFNMMNNELCKLVIKDSIKIENIIEYISFYLNNKRTISSIGDMELAILVLSFIQFKDTDIHHTIVINEAIELAKDYCDSNAYKFINGVLDNMSNNISKE